MLARDGVVYEFGSIRLDPVKRIIAREGESVPLPPRAFDLILLLIERRGELVLKEELLATIWPDVHVEESSLPVMISLIRRAIGDDGRKQHDIQTVSKQGYRFISEVKETPAAEPLSTSSAEPDTGASLVPQAVVPESLKLDYSRVSVITAGLIVTAALLFLLMRFGGVHNHQEQVAEAAARITDEAGQAASEATPQMWYRKGRYAWSLQTKAGILQSIEYYQKAITGDAGYAPAWAGLAISNVILPSYSLPSDATDRDRAKAEALKAASLDNRLTDAHIAVAMVSMIDEWNFIRAEHELRKAVELDPASSFARGELALCLAAVNRTEEAVTQARKAKALDPLSSKAATDLGIVLYYAHRFTEAQTEFEEVLKLNPFSYRTHVNLGKTYLSLERFDDAIQEFEQASALSNHDPLTEGLMAEARALAGDSKGAKAILAALQQRARTTYVSPASFAFASVGLGDPAETLEYLRKARADRAIAAMFLNVDPNWEPLHGDPDFEKLVKDITLAPQGNTASVSRKPAPARSLWSLFPGDEESEKSK
jgi:DNA-binding winged helix-turn-helix (wHTH) protein/Flp pilus assembly protein TadD